MCLMAVAPSKLAIPRDYLQNAYDHNSDGWGVMYALDGRVICHKEKSGMSRMYKYWDSIPEGVNVGVHFRFGTSGPKTTASCHPFPVLEKSKGDPFDLYMMHNGVLRHLRGTDKASDTMQLVERMRAQLQRFPALLRDRIWREDQEEILGNPNKIVFLEGNGRWTYLNYDQGKRYESGVWYSNEYSLDPVYSGHGRGKAANRSVPAWSDDDWQGYYGNGTTVTRYDSGGLVKSGTNDVADFTSRYAATIGKPDKTDMTWALQLSGPPDNRVKTYWRKTWTGWTRYAENPSTGAKYRDYKHEGEKPSADICTVLPRDCIQFRPKNDNAWLRGDRHNFELVAGEYHAMPVVEGGAGMATATLYSASEATAATAPQLTMLLDEKDVAKVADACGVPGVTPQQTFPVAAHGASDGFSIAGMVARIMGREEPLDAAMAERDAADREAREEKEREEEYLAQLFSDQNLQSMSYDDMLDAVDQYPEDAAIALGRLSNCRWAWEDESEVA
jgi:hypothetical protein